MNTANIVPTISWQDGIPAKLLKSELGPDFIEVNAYITELNTLEQSQGLHSPTSAKAICRTIRTIFSNTPYKSNPSIWIRSMKQHHCTLQKFPGFTGTNCFDMVKYLTDLGVLESTHIKGFTPDKFLKQTTYIAQLEVFCHKVEKYPKFLLKLPISQEIILNGLYTGAWDHKLITKALTGNNKPAIIIGNIKGDHVANWLKEGKITIKHITEAIDAVDGLNLPDAATIKFKLEQLANPEWDLSDATKLEPKEAIDLLYTLNPNTKMRKAGKKIIVELTNAALKGNDEDKGNLLGVIIRKIKSPELFSVVLEKGITPNLMTLNMTTEKIEPFAYALIRNILKTENGVNDGLEFLKISITKGLIDTKKPLSELALSDLHANLKGQRSNEIFPVKRIDEFLELIHKISPLPSVETCVKEYPNIHQKVIEKLARIESLKNLSEFRPRATLDSEIELG